jgi:hypothetical protein
MAPVNFLCSLAQVQPMVRRHLFLALLFSFLTFILFSASCFRGQMKGRKRRARDFPPRVIIYGQDKTQTGWLDERGVVFLGTYVVYSRAIESNTEMLSRQWRCYLCDVM